MNIICSLPVFVFVACSLSADWVRAGLVPQPLDLSSSLSCPLSFCFQLLLFAVRKDQTISFIKYTNQITLRPVFSNFPIPLFPNQAVNIRNGVDNQFYIDFSSMKINPMKKGSILNPESSRKFQVSCRVRPLQESEPSQDISINAHPPSITIHNLKTSISKNYKFHRVYSDTVKQEDFTRAVTEKVYLKCLDTGKGCLVLSYGVTNSGKTYTILGTGKEPGILPALVTKFEEQMPGKQIKIRALEIYNDDLYCLRSGEKLPTKNHQFLDGCEYEKITKATSRTIIEGFIRSRKTVETKANRASSRSHAIFMIKCEQYHIGITDLAGNQRLDTNPNLNETCSINKNLLTLGRCIHAFRDGEQLPYRQSKLTLALMEYFKPRYKIFMITHINRTGKMFYENINVLDYATASINVKHINPIKNKSIALDTAKEKKKVTEMKEKREMEEVSTEYFKEEDYKGMKFLEGQQANQCFSPEKSNTMWPNKLSAESIIKLKQMFLEEQRLEKEEKMKDAATEMGPSMKKQPNIPSTNGQSQGMITPSKLPSNPQSESYLKEVMKTPTLMIQSNIHMITKFEEIANNMMESFKSMIGKQQEQAPKQSKKQQMRLMTLDDLENEWEDIKKVDPAQYKMEMKEFFKQWDDMKKAEQAKELVKRQKEIEGNELDEGKRKVEKSRGRPLTNAEQKSKKNNN